MNENEKNNENYENLFSTETEADEVVSDEPSDVTAEEPQNDVADECEEAAETEERDLDEQEDVEPEVKPLGVNKNNKKDKLLSIALIVLAAAIIVACVIFVIGGKDTNNGNKGASESTSGTAVTTPGGSAGSTETAKPMYVPGKDENADKVSVSTENFSVTNAGMAYFFQSSYRSLLMYMENYGMSADSVGLDISKSLKEQDCSFVDGTWYDYIMDSDVKNTVKKILSICEAAKAAGFELTEEQKNTIETQFSTLVSYAQQEKLTVDEYIAKTFGADVTSDVVYDMMELSLYASAYVEHCVNNADVSDAALEAKYSENPDKIDTTDFIIISLDYNELIPENADDAAKEEAKNNCRTYASEIAKATDKESFLAAVKTCLIDNFGLEDADAESVLKSIVYKGQSMGEGEIYDWAFGDVQPGETKVFEDEETALVAVAYFIGRNEKSTAPASADVHYILFSKDKYSDDTVAQQVYKDWVDSGATVESLEALVKQYTDDSSSLETNGLYKGVTPGATVPGFNDWVFDPARKVGDHGVVETSEFGWFIIYMDKLGEPAWKSAAETLIKNETQKNVTENAEKTYTVTVNEEILATLPA